MGQGRKGWLSDFQKVVKMKWLIWVACAGAISIITAAEDVSSLMWSLFGFNCYHYSKPHEWQGLLRPGDGNFCCLLSVVCNSVIKKHPRNESVYGQGWLLGGSCGGGSSQRCALSLGARTGGARAAAGGSPAATLLWHGPAVGNARDTEQQPCWRISGKKALFGPADFTLKKIIFWVFIPKSS